MELLGAFKSSSIEWVGYDRQNSVLHVRYAGNDMVYEYEEVPRKKWKELQKAASKGQYINLHIKPFHKVTAPE